MERKSFKEGFLSDLKSRVSLVDLVNKYSEVEKKGGRYWARCPFHHEKHASFTILEDAGVYKCFGCGESGDAIEFVRKMDNLDFYSAVEKLANSVNLELQFSDDSSGIDYSKLIQEKKLMLSAIASATEFYKNELYKDTAIIAQNYIKKRKLNRKSLEDFCIGYSPNFDKLVKEMHSQNVSDEILVNSGLCSESQSFSHEMQTDSKHKEQFPIKKNRRIYDAQSERLVFPIYNELGQVVGFSGRILTDNKDLAKYKNTKATPVFDKSKTLFGLFQAVKSKGLESHNFSLLVEGQIDVIMLHQFGFNNAMATLGTAFTLDHASILKRHNKNVVICYDGDEAGQKATMKAGDILFNAGLNVKVVALPDNLDPDEYIRQYGQEKFSELLSKAEEFYDYKLRKWAEEMNISSNFDKTEYIKKAIDLIAKLPSVAESEIYLPNIKNYTNVSIDTLRKTLYAKRNEIIDKKQEIEKDGLEQFNENLFEDANQKADKFILSSILYNKSYVENADFTNLEFKNPEYQKLYLDIMKRNKQNQHYKISDLYDEYDVENNKSIKDLIFFNFSDSDDINSAYFFESIKQNEITKLKALSEKLENDYNNCSDLQERSNLARQLMQVKLKLKEKGQQ